MTQEPTHQCPTPTAHRRLDEAHKWWHGCLTNYDNVDDFRANLNAGIQALRNVTWMVQKEKNLIPDFDRWYGAWQETLKADPLMKWLVKSRNRVVKEGDLELHSSAFFSFAFGYSGAANVYSSGLPDTAQEYETKREIPPLTRPSEYASRLPYMGLPRFFWQDTVLFVQRTWVDRALPDRELLDAYAHCYGVLAQLLADAHDQAEVPHEVFDYSGEEPVAVPRANLNGRLPCMTNTVTQRTASYAIGQDGLEPIVYVSRQVTLPSQKLEKAERKYGLADDWSDKLRNADSFLDHTPLYVERAKKILAKDKGHITVCLLYREKEPIDYFPINMESHADKMVVAQLIADRVQLKQADGVIIIGEMWVAKPTYDDDGFPIRATDSPDRTEALGVIAKNSRGEGRMITTPFTRRFGRIRYGAEIDETGDFYYGLLSVVARVWATWQEGEKRNEGDDPQL